MTDQTTGTPGQDGGDAALAQTAGTPVTDGGNAAAAGETPEQRIARLEAIAAEAERLKQEKNQWLSEKSNYEDAKRRLAEYEQWAVSTPPTAAAAADPLDAIIVDLWKQMQSYPDDPSLKFNYALALERKQQRDAYLAAQRTRPVFDAMDESIRERAWALWTGGQAATPDAARLAALGEQYEQTLKKRATADAQAAAAAATRPATAVVGVGSPAAGGRMKASDYLTQLDKNPRLAKLADEGKIEIDWDE